MMKFCICTSYKLYRLLGNTIDETFSVLKEIGIQAISPDDVIPVEETDRHCSMLKAASEKYGISLSYLHLPYVIEANSDVFLGDAFFEKTLRGIDMAKKMGTRYVVIHPFTPFKYEFYNKEEKFVYTPEIRQFCENINLTFFKRIQPYLLEAGLSCAIENIYTTDNDFREQLPSCCSFSDEWKNYIDNLGEPFCACLDTGHANLTDRSNEAIIQKIYDLGKRIKVLHLNDNYGKWLKIGDFHQMPFMGDIDWFDVVKALKETGYDGDLNFELLLNTKNRDVCIAQLRYVKAIADILLTSVQ